MHAERKEPDACELAERERARAARLRRADIPARYADASIDEANEEVRKWVEEFGPATRDGLVLYGDIGTGKTHAACAALIELADRVTVRFASGSDILREIRSTYGGRAESELDVFSRYTGPRVLVIDDIGKEQATDWALSTLFSIVDKRYRSGKPTIYTCQMTGNGLRSALSLKGDSTAVDAIIDRMRDGVQVRFSGPSLRGRGV